MNPEPVAEKTHYGYFPDLEIATGYAQMFPNNCAIRERTADGDSVGPCCFHLAHGTTCPRHGIVKPPRSNDP